MITWITGPANSGKTSLAESIQTFHKNTIVLDADILRQILKNPRYSDFLLNVAFLSKLLSDQGFDVAVSAIIDSEVTKLIITKHCNPQWVVLNES